MAAAGRPGGCEGCAGGDGGVGGPAVERHAGRGVPAPETRRDVRRVG